MGESGREAKDEGRKGGEFSSVERDGNSRFHHLIGDAQAWEQELLKLSKFADRDGVFKRGKQDLGQREVGFIELLKKAHGARVGDSGATEVQTMERRCFRESEHQLLA